MFFCNTVFQGMARYLINGAYYTPCESKGVKFWKPVDVNVTQPPALGDRAVSSRMANATEDTEPPSLDEGLLIMGNIDWRKDFI